MFVLRNWRLNMFGGGFLRISRYSLNNVGRQLSEHLCLLNVDARFYKLKCHSYANFAAFKCWNCQTVVDTSVPRLFCKNCSLIQSSEQQNFNYFELFNICEQYDIDVRQLTLNFRNLQNRLHPDKFSNKSKEEKILSESFSSLLNKAYTTLVNPLLRGLYMLNVNGLNIEEGSVTMDPSFLGEIMEWNEQVEEANTKESLENLKQNIDVILINLYKEISKAFNDNNLNEAKTLLSKAKYYSTLLEKIKEIDVQ